MSDNVFADSNAGTKDPDAGLTNVGDLVAKTANVVMEDPMSWVLGGLVPGIFLLFSVFGMVFGVYGAMFVGMMPGMVSGDDDAAALGAMGAALGAMSVLMIGMMLILTPMWASLYRAVWAHLIHGEKLTIGAATSTFFQDLPAIFLYSLLSAAIVMAGLTLCYVPGLVAQGMLIFAWPAVVIHRMPVGRAISWSFGHAAAHPAWHLGVWAVTFVMAMVLPYIPILGYMLLFTVHTLFVVLAYRAAAGDGEVPREF